MSTREIISIVVAVIAGGVWAVLELKRWRSTRREKKMEQESNLAPNPARCADHETRLRSVEEVCHTIGPKLTGIETSLVDVKASLKTLTELHLEK